MSDNETNPETIKEIARMARAAAPVITGLPDGKTGILLPDGYHLEKLQEKHPTPTDIVGRIDLTETASFTQYVNRFKTNDTQLIADMDRTLIKATIDYHKSDGTPAKALPHAYLSIKLSDEWLAWSKINGQFMDQQSFAQFIEENSIDIIDPDGATLLEMVSHLKARKNVEFESGKNLQNGETQFVYREEIKGTAHKGEITIPDKIELLIPILFKGVELEVQAFLRYRIDEARLMFKIDLHRPEHILSDAFDSVLEQISKTVGILPYHGRI